MTPVLEYLVFAQESPTEIHKHWCDRIPDSDHTGDATGQVVLEPDAYTDDDETISVDCACLDRLLGIDRDRDRIPNTWHRRPPLDWLHSSKLELQHDETGLIVRVRSNRVPSGVTLDGSEDDDTGFISEVVGEHVEPISPPLADLVNATNRAVDFVEAHPLGDFRTRLLTEWDDYRHPDDW